MPIQQEGCPQRGPPARCATLKHRLPGWEYHLYLLLSLAVHFYTFSSVFSSSQKHEAELDREVGLETDIWGLRKDSSDFEWSFWMGWAGARILWLMLGHVAVSWSARIWGGKSRWWLLTVYGALACWIVLGTKGLAAIFVKTLIFYGVARVKSRLLVWFSLACALAMVHQTEGGEDAGQGWYTTESEYYLLQFTLTVRTLFYVSFCLEFWEHGAEDSDGRFSFASLLTYVFYYPLFHNGPVITFDEFSRQTQRPDTRSDFRPALLLADVVRLLLWWCLAEAMLRAMFIHAMFHHHQLLEDSSYWTLGGLALAQVLFFYVKYLVLYGFPALLLWLDGLDPPALPRCVSTMHSFSGIWRCFDVGLHRFLVRYIYIPMGGSHRGVLGIMASSALTFIFVCCWHGGHTYLWYWAAINWIGLITEHAVKMLLSIPLVQERIRQRLSPRMIRQLHAVLAAISTAFLILSNLVFLGGEHIGRIFCHRMFVQGWPWVPLMVLGCLYCFAQVGIEWSTSLFHEYKWKFPLCAARKAKARCD